MAAIVRRCSRLTAHSRVLANDLSSSECAAHDTALLRLPYLPRYARPTPGAAERPLGTSAAADAAATWQHLQESYTTIKVDVEQRTGVATLTLNRPEVLNALNSKAMEEVVSACMYLDRQHASARVMIITGTGKAFAAGADIKEMATLTYSDAYNRGLLNGWEALRSVRKPLIAAVNGYALGGGCELAMMCDIILAADSAAFGQPELTLGVIPGMGATQRLVRAVGKSRAMEMILTGARVGAGEAARIGLVSRVVPADRLMDEAQRVAAKIAEYSSPVVAKAKECVNAAFEVGLAEGVKLEKREFWACFALADQKEGMAAFVQKRPPEFKNK